MNRLPKSLQWIVWGSVVATIAAIVVAFIIQQTRQEQNPPDNVETELVATSPNAPLPVLFAVADFALTNQSGKLVTGSELRGQVWIADIIFTRCAGPCPEMTRRMAELQSAIPAKSPVRFVSLTADPDHDTPSVLQAYARRFAAQPDRWHFLTGTKKQIVDLAIDGLKLTALDKEEAKRENLNDLFIHSTIFVIIDRQGRARAVIESDDPSMKLKALAAVQRLLDEK